MYYSALIYVHKLWDCPKPEQGSQISTITEHKESYKGACWPPCQLTQLSKQTAFVGA